MRNATVLLVLFFVTHEQNSVFINFIQIRFSIFMIMLQETMWKTFQRFFHEILR